MASGSTVIYFAYGSNMKTSRLQSRVPSAKALGRARLLGKRLACNRQSVDRSVIGQPRQQDLLEFLTALHPTKDLDRLVEQFVIDLAPPSKQDS